MNNHHLILGGAKSGKTSFAEQRALSLCPKPLYLATGQAWDDEMRVKIDAHKAARADRFTTIEEPLALMDSIRRYQNNSECLLIDCLTLWITNLMMAERDVQAAVDDLCGLLQTIENQEIILVSNEVGQGITPDNKMARTFINHAGLAHQKLAKICGNVSFITAGLEQKLKP